MIDGVNYVGGIHKFRTTGYNSTVGILSSLTLIRSLTGGYLAGLPLRMTIQPKVCTNPIDGGSQTVYVVGIEFAGSMDDLYCKTLEIAKKNADFRARMIGVEDEVKKLISVDAGLIDEAGDIQEEFYPPEDDKPQLETVEDNPGETSVTGDFQDVPDSTVEKVATSGKAGKAKKSDANKSVLQDRSKVIGKEPVIVDEPEIDEVKPETAPALELDPAINEADFFGGAQ
jgi:hypothetical protein